MNLTKEECLKALSNIRMSYGIPFSTVETIEQLINEHFKDEYAFDGSREKIESPKDLQRHLYRGESAAQIDANTFRKWEQSRISTAMALRQFRENNGIPHNVEISEEVFKEFMYGLGWGAGDE